MKRKLLFFASILFLFSCNNQVQKTKAYEKSKSDFTKTMKKHLDAVSNKDLVSLKSTMHPNGKMQLILPSSEIKSSVDSFMLYHSDWFKDTSEWSFETKIINIEVGQDYGMAITEIKYSEPEREGKPYWHRMSVSYDLEKYEDNWYIIKDHASSIQKSTD